MAGISSHKQAGIAVCTVDLAAGVWIQAIVEDLGSIENALGLDLFDLQHGLVLVSFTDQEIAPIFCRRIQEMRLCIRTTASWIGLLFAF